MFLASAVSTSHLGIYYPLYFTKDARGFTVQELRDKAQDLQEEYFPGVSIIAKGGMILLEEEFQAGSSTRSSPKSEIRVKQVKKITRFVEDSTDKVGLLVLGSNDFKSFLIREGAWLRPGKGAVDRWYQLPLHQKINFSERSAGRILCRSARDHIQSTAHEYVKVILKLVNKGGFQSVIHSSLLERDWSAIGVPHLGMWFAHINYELRREMSKLELDPAATNRFGERIRFKFLNVSAQYFVAEAQSTLDTIFREEATAKSGRTHRNEDSLNMLSRLYMEEIKTAYRELAEI